MAALDRRVYVLVAVGAAADHRQMWPAALREAALRFVRPLHRGACALALGQSQIVAHADLVAIADDRSPGQRKQQAVGQFETPLIAVEHRRETAADAAVVGLDGRTRPERSEHLLPLLIGQPAEIELIVVAQ